MTVDRAVIWDYDGTLVDTGEKNLRVTRRLIPDVSGRPLEEFPALATPASYRQANRRSSNWRELFGKEFGLNSKQVAEAGRLWTQYQLADQTPSPFFEGIPQALRSLKGSPQAIFSQNSRAAIQLSLASAGLDDCINLVVGYEEVASEHQKPAPEGLLYCLKQLGIRHGRVFFAGDHDTDMECARRANAALKQQHTPLTVVAVGVAFDPESRAPWAVKPDHVARRPVDIVQLVLDSRA